MILAPLAFNSIWGLDTFPWFAKRYELGVGERNVVRLQAGPAFPDVSYANLIARKPTSILVSSASGQIENVLLQIEEFVGRLPNVNKGGLKSGQWYLVPPGHYRFRLQVDYNQEGPAIHVVTLDLEERDVPSSEGVQRLGPDAQPVAITLRPDDLGIWRGEISIEAPVDPAGSARPVVSFTRLGSVSTRLGDFHIEGADSISVPGRPYLEHPNAMSLVVVTPTSLSPLI